MREWENTPQKEKTSMRPPVMIASHYHRESIMTEAVSLWTINEIATLEYCLGLFEAIVA